MYIQDYIDDMENNSSQNKVKSDHLDTEKDICFFDRLSDEVILEIFTKLGKADRINCSLICKRWKNIAYDSQLWQRIDLSESVLSSEKMMFILTKNPVALCMFQTKTCFPLLTNLSDNVEDGLRLEYLDMTRTGIHISDLQRLLHKCRRLIKLSLEDRELNDTVCWEIAQNRRLTVLSISKSSNVSKSGIQFIIDNCKKLEELNISWTDLEKDALHYVCASITDSIKKLNLSGFEKKLNDDHVELLLSRCHILTELDLSDCTGLTSDVIISIKRNLNQLQHLSINRCYGIKRVAISFLMRDCCSLSHLDIFGLANMTRQSLPPDRHIEINKSRFSTIARPFGVVKRDTIWGLRLTLY